MPSGQPSGSTDRFLFKNARQSSARGSVDLLSQETGPSPSRAYVGSGFSGFGNHASTATIVPSALILRRHSRLSVPKEELDKRRAGGGRGVGCVGSRAGGEGRVVGGGGGVEWGRGRGGGGGGVMGLLGGGG